MLMSDILKCFDILTVNLCKLDNIRLLEINFKIFPHFVVDRGRYVMNDVEHFTVDNLKNINFRAFNHPLSNIITKLVLNIMQDKIPTKNLKKEDILVKV